jgi:hypothetical protein
LALLTTQASSPADAKGRPSLNDPRCAPGAGENLRRAAVGRGAGRRSRTPTSRATSRAPAKPVAATASVAASPKAPTHWGAQGAPAQGRASYSAAHVSSRRRDLRS